MQLNPDCIRDVLLTVEDMCNGRVQYFYDGNEALIELIEGSEHLQNYTGDEVDYHFIQVINAGYLVGAEQLQKGFCFMDLSPSGHEFLNNVRDNTVWNSVKEKVKPIGTVSLSIIGQLGATIAKSLLGLE